MEDTNAGIPATSVEATQPETQVNEAAATATTEQNSESPQTQAKPYNDPEKLAKALDRKNRAIGRKTAELHEARRRIQELEQKSAPSQPINPAPAALKPESFPTVEAYFEAVAEAKADAKIREYQTKNETNAKERQASDYRAQRLAEADAKAEELKKQIPDFEQVLSEYGDDLQSAGAHVHDAILEADDPALVAYYAAKEGLFDQLNAMSPIRAGKEIERIEQKAKALIATKPTSNAPPPLAPVKGAGGSKGNGISPSMSYNDLKKWMKS